MRREWIKLYLSDWLDDGFTSFLTLAQMGAAAKLWALAGRMTDQGVIHKRRGTPFSLKELGTRLKIKTTLLGITLAKLEDYGFITRDQDGIRWTHWDEDQPPYLPVETRRQLPPDESKFARQKFSNLVRTKELTPRQHKAQAKLDAKLPEGELAELPVVRRRAAKAYLIDHPKQDKLPHPPER
jgi:hypothetical protein